MSKLRKFILSVLLIYIFQIPANANKWGSLTECHKKWPKCSAGKNIVCQRPFCGPIRPTCHQLETTRAFRQRNLDVQNDRRDFIASGKETHAGAVKASNMHIFNYDFGLEYTAICNANTCVMDHDECRGTERFIKAGQNLGTNATKGKLDVDLDQVERFIHMWYDEVAIEGYTIPIDSWEKYTGPGHTGHFTALVWAETTHIGCGWSYENKSNSNAVFVSCNYGPMNNRPGKPVYQKGDPCTACAANETCSKKFTSLCGEEDGKNLDGVNPYGGADRIRAGLGIFGSLFVTMISTVVWANFYFN